MERLISNTDIYVIIAYFLVVFAIGFWVALRTKSGEDLFLGGRTLTWGVIGLSLFASNISSATIIGLTGAAYSSGIVQSVYEWISGIPLIIFAFIFVPLYLNSKITTIPEYLARRFDRRSQVFFSVVTILTSILVETAGGLYAGAIVLKTFFPNIVIWQTTFVLAVFAGLYTAFGGLKAVAYTDTLQAIILIVGSSVLTYILFEKIDFSLETMINSAPEGHFSIINPIDDPTLPWPGLFMGVLILGFWYWTTNQYIVQRVLGAKNVQHARWGVIFGGFLKLIPLFIMVIPGAMAISIYQNIDNPDMVYPTIVLNALPVGLIGLVLAGLISAIMSSVDSTLNSSSTLIVIDFIKPRKPNITSKEVAKYGRISTLVLMVVAAAWAPNIANFGGLWIYLQQMYTIFVPPIVVLFIVGVFYKKGNGEGAFQTLLWGTIIGLVLFVLAQFDLWSLHFTITAGIVFLISIGIFVFVSNRNTPPSDEIVRHYMYNSELSMQDNHGMAWYRDYRVWAVLLFLSIVGIFHTIILKGVKKVKLFIATSIDGYIARKDDSLDWLDSFEGADSGQEDYGYHSFISGIDTLIMGSSTYKVVMGMGVEWPYKETSYIISHDEIKIDSPNTLLLDAANLDQRIDELRREQGKDIWLVGGGKLIATFLSKGLIDEMILSIIPVLLGEGVRLFPENYHPDVKISAHK